MKMTLLDKFPVTTEDFARMYFTAVKSDFPLFVLHVYGGLSGSEDIPRDTIDGLLDASKQLSKYMKFLLKFPERNFREIDLDILKRSAQDLANFNSKQYLENSLTFVEGLSDCVLSTLIKCNTSKGSIDSFVMSPVIEYMRKCGVDYFLEDLIADVDDSGADHSATN
jgi:hypothetical protein